MPAIGLAALLLPAFYLLRRRRIACRQPSPTVSRIELQKLLDRLPERERKSATDRIRAAEISGWTGISIWDDYGNADEMDLVGVDAKGDFDFLP